MTSKPYISPRYHSDLDDDFERTVMRFNAALTEACMWDQSMLSSRAGRLRSGLRKLKDAIRQAESHPELQPRLNENHRDPRSTPVR